MQRLVKSVGCVVACVSVVSGCGPGIADEEINSSESTVSTPKKSEAPPPDVSEVDETGIVHALEVHDLGSRMGSPVATDSSISTASNLWYVSCNNGTSRDISYVWTVPETGSYRIGTAWSNFDTVLQVRNFRNTSEILGCNDDNAAAGTLQSRLDFNLTKGTVLLIIVEAFGAGYGDDLRLNIARN